MSEALEKLKEKTRQVNRMMREAKALAANRLSDPVQTKRDRLAKYSREHTAAVADIGAIPPVVDPARREACRLDLHGFLTTYFPASTGLSPFSDDHRRVIGRIQSCIIEGGLFVNAIYRGFAKTTISENASLWALLYGYRRFVPIFGAAADNADGNIDSVKLELSENDLLYADFPEVCHAVRALEGKSQRCGSQNHGGKLTHIEWTADQIVLPVIEGSLASGAVLIARGITAASRGLKHKGADGTQQRPDFVIIDDPQTDESAGSPLQINKRLDTIRKTILKLGGHNRKIAVVVNATVIQPDDLIEQLLEAKKFPSWQGERIPMVRKWADDHDTLWMTEYARGRNTYDADTLGDQQRAHREATEFYRANRPKMDSGAVVSWEHCFDLVTEISAVQHAYNALIDDGPAVFASECQNAPLRDDKSDKDLSISAAAVCEKLNGVPRGVVPLEVTRLVAFVDVQKTLMFWLVAGFSDDFSGAVVEYGTYPGQGRVNFAARDARRTLMKETGAKSLEEALYAGLDATAGLIMGREWQRADGVSLKIERCLIDANWGDSTDLVYQFCRQSPHATSLTPSHGMYVGAKSRRFTDYHPKPGDRTGHGWRMPSPAGRRAVRYAVFDANAWKTFMISRLKTPMGGRGCLALFGDAPEMHQMLAGHLTSERPIEVTANGRSVIEWSLMPSRPDNHWLDCLVGCGVAASIQGAKLKEMQAGPPVRKIVRLSSGQLGQKRIIHHG